MLRQLRIVFIKRVGILLAMLAAGLLGRIVSEAATSQMNDELSKLIMGIVTGALIGLAVGILVRRAWGRLLGSF